MAGRRTETQEELEAPAKVYQFNDLADQLQRVEAIVNKMSEKLEAQVTANYLENRLVAQSTSWDDKLKGELKDRDIRMNGFEKDVKTNNKRMNTFTGAIIAVGVIVIASAIGVIYFTSLSR